jgi:hypothetical protein
MSSARQVSPGGMLDSYLHEKHAVLEQEVSKSSQQHEGGVADHGSDTGHTAMAAAGAEHHEEKVADLDKYMAAITDRRILKQGREDQKGESLFSASAPRC